jgi:hypothetical protein
MNTSDSGSEIPANDSVAIQIAQAATHLKGAMAIVDRLLTETRAGSSEPYPLGEASRSMHHALLALTECHP